MAWEKAQLSYLAEKEVMKLELAQPLEIQYVFRLPDKRRTDISNKLESVNDLLVEYGLLLDDNCLIIDTIKAKYAGIDRADPRCEIRIQVLDI